MCVQTCVENVDNSRSCRKHLRINAKIIRGNVWSPSIIEQITLLNNTGDYSTSICVLFFLLAPCLFKCSDLLNFTYLDFHESLIQI